MTDVSEHHSKQERKGYDIEKSRICFLVMRNPKSRKHLILCNCEGVCLEKSGLFFTQNRNQLRHWHFIFKKSELKSICERRDKICRHINLSLGKRVLHFNSTETGVNGLLMQKIQFVIFQLVHFKLMFGWNSLQQTLVNPLGLFIHQLLHFVVLEGQLLQIS